MERGKPIAQLNSGDETMTRAEFAKGSATFLVVIVAGLLSETYLDRHLAAVETDKKATSRDGTDGSAPTTSCLQPTMKWRRVSLLVRLPRMCACPRTLESLGSTTLESPK